MFPSSLGDFFGQIGSMSIVACVLAIAATVLAFVFIVPEKKYAKLNGFGKFLHKTVNFKFLIIEKILQAVYIFYTVFVILVGVFMLFMTTPSYSGYGYSGGGTWLGGYGLLVIILGPIVIRIFYELLMMLVLLIKNVISINNKLKNQNGDDVAADVFATPDMDEIKSAFKAAPVPAPAPATEPVAQFCTKCGAKLDENGKCPACDQ